MTNKQLQDLLKQYPDDMPIGTIVDNPDAYAEWDVEEATGVNEMHFGFKNCEKTKPKCLVIN